MKLSKLALLNLLLCVVLFYVAYFGVDMVVFNAWLTIEKGLIFTFSLLFVGSVYYTVKY